MSDPCGCCQSQYGLGGVSLVLILVIAVVMIVFFLAFNSHRTNSETHGIAFKLQNGVTTGSTDSMRTGGNNLYIANSSSPLTLTVLSNDSNQQGRIIAIKNNTTHSTTLVGESGKVTLDPGHLNLTVIPGHTAYLVTIKEDTFLRLV